MTLLITRAHLTKDGLRELIAAPVLLREKREESDGAVTTPAHCSIAAGVGRPLRC
jgi:hypothetical protein